MLFSCESSSDVVLNNGSGFSDAVCRFQPDIHCYRNNFGLFVVVCQARKFVAHVYAGDVIKNIRFALRGASR